MRGKQKPMKSIYFQIVIKLSVFAILLIPNESKASQNPFPSDVNAYQLTYETGVARDYLDYLFVTFQPLSNIDSRAMVKECMSSEHGDAVCDETDPQFSEEDECPGEAHPPAQTNPGETAPAEPCDEVMGIPYAETLHDLVSETVDDATGKITYKLSYQKGFLMYGFPIALAVNQFATPVLDVTKAQMASSTTPDTVQDQKPPAATMAPSKPSDKIRKPVVPPEEITEDETFQNVETLDADGPTCQLSPQYAKPSLLPFVMCLFPLLFFGRARRKYLTF